jgi:uncharacterized coiled-coil protein SlyX
VTAPVHAKAWSEDMVRDLVDERREAQRRVGELEAKLAEREGALRELRRRLRELEQPYWVHQSALVEEFQSAQWRITELEGKLNPFDETPTVSARLNELAALKATKTFRYTYPLRVGAHKVRRRLGALRRSL